MEPTKLYTITEVAELTSLTTRTLRNHLKAGTLCGNKVGGQWRFTIEEIEAFTHGRKPEIQIESTSPIDEFLNASGKKGTQVMTVVDVYGDEERGVAKEILLRNLVNWYDNRNNMSYTHEFLGEKTRFIIFATPELMISALDLLS